MVSSTTRHRRHVLIIDFTTTSIACLMTFSGSISEKKIGGTQETYTLDIALPGTKLQGSPIVRSSTFKGRILGDIVPDSEKDRIKSG